MLKLLALGVIAFIVSLVITAPAHLARDYLPSGIQASGLQGTLLRGQAQRVQAQGFNLGAVDWNMQPLSLLMGRLASDVSLDQPDLQGQGTIGVGFNSISFNDTHLTGGTQLLAPYLMSRYGVNIDGSLKADARSLQANARGPQAADGVLVWRDARLLSPALLDLGDVNVVVRQDGDTAVAELSNTGETLRLRGEARVQPGWKYTARLRLEPTRSTSRQVRNTLALLGQPDARGAITLSQQGTLELAERLP